MAVVFLCPQLAGAHPLGNSSVNHLTYVKVFPNRVSMLYVLDQAEYPTVRDLRRTNSRGFFLSKVEEVRRRLGGHRRRSPWPADLQPESADEIRRGVGNLLTVRIALPVVVRDSRPRRVVVEDRTFPGRLGVVLVVPLAGERTAVRRLDGPVDDPSRGLRPVPPDGKYERRCRSRLAEAR